MVKTVGKVTSRITGGSARRSRARKRVRTRINLPLMLLPNPPSTLPRLPRLPRLPPLPPKHRCNV